MVFSNEEWKQGLKTHLKVSNLSMLPLLGIAIMAVALIGWFAMDRWTWGWAERFCFYAGIFVGVSLVMYPKMALGMASGKLHLDPRLGREISWKIASDGAEATGDGVEFKTTWKECYAIRVASQGILLYPFRSPLSNLIHREIGQWHWIPATAFPSDAAFQDAKKLIHAEMRKIGADSAKYQKD